MSINPILSRMLSIRTLQNDMISYLYSKQEERIVELLGYIAIENQQLLQCATPTFAYNHKLYGSDFINHSGTQVNKILHPSLLRKVCDIITAPDFNMTLIKTHINHMFSIILVKAKHTNDLRKLLPNIFLTQIQKIDPDIFNIGNPLSEQAIQTIKNKIAKSTIYINELCLTQLLLTK